MPETLKDKLVDFGLMLDGCLVGETVGQESTIRILNYYYDLKQEIIKELKLDEEVS